jgi:hypothetical protein
MATLEVASMVTNYLKPRGLPGGQSGSPGSLVDRLQKPAGATLYTIAASETEQTELCRLWHMSYDEKSFTVNALAARLFADP